MRARSMALFSLVFVIRKNDGRRFQFLLLGMRERWKLISTIESSKIMSASYTLTQSMHRK